MGRGSLVIVEVDGSRALGGLHIRTELVWNDFKLLHAGLGFSFLASVLVLDPRSESKQASKPSLLSALAHKTQQQATFKQQIKTSYKQ